MTNLSEQQIKFYNEKGYVAPIDVLSIQEANEIREEIETIEKKWPNAIEGLGRNYVHMISPVFNNVCLNKKILDAVESIIGKNILICGTTLFIKNANEKGFNLLTRGQTIENVPIEETEPVILKAGQMSLHHPTVIHGSGLNRSNDRRIGFVVQSYIGSNVDQVLGKIYVQKARGEDTHKFHEYSNVPKGLMSKEDIISWNKAKDELSKIFYSGATKKGKY